LLQYPDFQLTIYDCLVGIYHVEHLKQEQTISMSDLNYSIIEDEIEESKNCVQTPSEKRFRKSIKYNLTLHEEKHTNLDITDANVNKAVEIFNQWNDGTFDVRDQVGDIINLDRLRTCECKISGRIHEKENAYLKLREDGHLIFCCRRGCQNNGSYGLDLGMYRVNKRPKDVVPLQTNKINMAKEATTVIVPFEITEVKQSVPRLKTGNNSAKRVQLGYVKTIIIPNSLKIK
jgi:putative NIF3 family GTP cyclohydrolase 1 type 2